MPRTQRSVPVARYAMSLTLRRAVMEDQLAKWRPADSPTPGDSSVSQALSFTGSI